ncbi:MAG: ribonuclease III [Ignavibacteriales bacterium]
MKVLEELEIVPRKISLYERAFTHTSFANEEGVESYERLEYLGDAVLELVMSEYLYSNTEYEEGMMTKLRAHYVCENALYEYSIKLGLNEYIRLGRGENDSGGKFRKTIVADIFESFIGALFLDQGMDFVKRFIYKHIIPLIERKEIDFFSDYKSVLQELVQTDKRSLEYVIVEEAGPSHDKTFTVQVKIDNIIYGEGTAHSKKQAEQEAAKNALKKAQNGLDH